MLRLVLKYLLNSLFVLERSLVPNVTLLSPLMHDTPNICLFLIIITHFKYDLYHELHNGPLI